MTKLIEEVVNEVQALRYKIVNESVDGRAEPKISIYMDYEYYKLCMSEISGVVNFNIHKFYERGTILDHNVFLVVGIPDGVSHPPFKVVEC